MVELKFILQFIEWRRNVLF